MLENSGLTADRERRKSTFPFTSHDRAVNSGKSDFGKKRELENRFLADNSFSHERAKEFLSNSRRSRNRNMNKFIYSSTYRTIVLRVEQINCF